MLYATCGADNYVDHLLWSPYGIGLTIIFLSCGFFLMAALWNRAGHYIFARGFLYFFIYLFIFFFFFSFFLSLWPPCVADADIIFLPCGFFLSSSSSSPNLSGRALDVYHTSTHDVVLVRI